LAAKERLKSRILRMLKKDEESDTRWQDCWASRRF
jgi:hypothetical protein